MAGSTLGRLALRRVAIAVEPAEVIVPSSVPWSRGLWGCFLPERRRHRAETPRPPGVPERRVSPTA